MEKNKNIQEIQNKRDMLFELQQIDMINDEKHVDTETLRDTTVGCGGYLTILCC